MDPEDVEWRSYFSEEELDEVRNEAVPVVAELPEAIIRYLEKYQNSMSLDDIRNLHIQRNCRPRTEPDLHWVKRQARQLRVVLTAIDIRFATEAFEFGTVEAGKETDTTNTKTIFESGFKTPKIMKDMYMKLYKQSPASVRQLKTFGFTLSE
ncbi:hypothetical protein INT45_014276 [Circinella minor]|uniref:Uncharacterized protein n=1 Tax=Circinella minor TaxID=1195481 RepID=A0A8H7SC01_9FUNG|nr:hypothetical protein INT45_014276 [Circinella minor]